MINFLLLADGNATDVGDLTISRSNLSGQSSAEIWVQHGRIFSAIVNTIDKFPFASDGNATDVGDISALHEGQWGSLVLLMGMQQGA